MAVYRSMISSFLIFAGVVLVIDGYDWDLSSNWTSEMQCPQIVDIYCFQSKLTSELLQWKADGDIFAEYTYKDSDTDFPIKLNSSKEGFEVTISNFSPHKFSGTYTINSSLIAESDIIQNYANIECDNGNAKGSIKVNFNCVDVYLQVNDTVEGEVCPGVLNFSSIAMNVESIVWYLGENELINYTVKSESKQPLNLCSLQEKNLTDLCNNGGSLRINKVTRNGSRFNVVSTLILTGTYIYDQQYLYVKSGSNNITKSVPTNFTLACGGPEDLNITYNITDVDCDSCDDIIAEFVCAGNDVRNFFWVYNNKTSMLSPNYTYSPSSFPVIVSTTILDLKIPISADTNNCLDKHFNFESKLTVSMGALNKKRIKRIGCVADDLQRWTAVNSNIGNWTLIANWTYEMHCPQILEININGTNLERSVWQWKANETVFTEYTYNDSDTNFPITLNSSIEGLEVTVLYVSEEDDAYTISSTLIAESDIIQEYEDIECDDGNSKGSIKVDFNCVVMHLQVNDTVEGEICPAGLNFSSIAINVESIVWYLGENELLNYTVNLESPQPIDLCTTQGKNDYLTDLCDNGGSLTINEITRNGNRYDVISTLILTGTFIFGRQYLYVESGSNNITETVYTNFTLVCGLKTLNINFSITGDDSDECDDAIGVFTCNGTDVPNFFWVFNNVTSMLSPNYTYSPSSFPVIVNGTILGLIIPILADTDNCTDKNFNFESKLTVSMSDLKEMGIKSIGCVADDLQSWTTVNCSISPWCQNLSFINKLPLCNFTESETCDNTAVAKCFGTVLSVLFVTITIILSCAIFWCCSCCLECYQVPRHMEQFLPNKTPTDQETEELSMFNCIAPCRHKHYKNYSDARPRRKITLVSLWIVKLKYWRLKKGYERIKTASDARIISKKVEEIGTQNLAKEFFFEIYGFVEELPDIGSRLQKFWYLRKKNGTLVMQFVAKKSAKCPVSFKSSIDSEFRVLKSIFQSIAHPHLLSIHDLDVQDEYITVIQEFVSEGSIRDKMFKATPTDDWSDKYTSSGGIEVFTSKEIAICGRHVLEAVLALYEIGFPQIGQIHCGNVFIVEDKFVLGGYENALLGYRTSLYGEISQAGLLSSIDVIMFGYMIYEMATGKPLNNLLPDEYAFEEVTDEYVKEVLQYIFKKKMRSEKKPMEKIRGHKFFSDASTGSQHVMTDMTVADDEKRLLKSVADFQKGETQKAFSHDDLFDFMEAISKLQIEYIGVQVYPRIGFRIGKTYAKARSMKLNADGLLTAMLIPESCSIVVKDNVKVIKKLLQLKHKYICQVGDIEYVKLSGQHLVVIFQDFINGGSLKDYIHRVSSPTSAWWTTKYGSRGMKMAHKEVARLGYQLLQAIDYLSHLDGHSDPLVLGCVHTGNIFLEDNNCKLGGFENSLLGCQFGQYRIPENSSSKLDVFMFGHVIYEMCTGRVLTIGIPNEKDYKDVPSQFIEVLKYIFDEATDIRMIMDHSFFTEYSSSDCSEVISNIVDEDMKHLLQQVRNKESVDQDGSRKTVSSFIKSGAQNIAKIFTWNH